MIAVRDGTARPLVRRGTTSDLLVRDIGLKEALDGAQALGPRTDDRGGNARPANRTAVFGRAHRPRVHLPGCPGASPGAVAAVDRPVLGGPARHGRAARH